MHFIIYSNFYREDDVMFVDEVVSAISKRGLTYSLTSFRQAEYMGHSFTKLSETIKKGDILIVIGGDGTVLRAIQDICVDGLDTMILAVNRGECGFLTDIEPSDIEDALDSFLNNEYTIDARTALKVSYLNRDYYALNEFVMYKGSITCPIVVNVSLADGTSISTVQADGVYISTPTGSTAYSLSAGGPILTPDTKALIIGSICSHSLLNKTFVLSDDNKFLIRLGKDYSSAKIMVDGIVMDSIFDNTPICVEKSQKTVNFINTKKINFFEKLDSKLSNWSDLNKFFKKSQED